MTDESSAAPTGAETEQPTSEPTGSVAEIEKDEPVSLDQTEGEGDAEQEAVEEIEFDFGGNKKKWAKGTPIDQIADEIDKFTKGTWSDYTRKSQEVAEQRKAVEAREGAVERLVSLNNEALDTYSRGLQVKQELQQLQQVDVNALWQSNPDQARRVSDLISQKSAEFQNIVSKVSQQEAALSQAQQTEVSRRMEEGRTIADKMIKGFSEKAPEVVDYVVKNFGMSKQEAETWPLNPKTAVMAYKAMMFDRMQAKATQTAKPPTQQATPVVPMKSKGGPAAKSVRDMSVSEIAKVLGLPT